MDLVQTPISAWESFYVIAGSSAAALTGLQFVVIALVAEVQNRSSTGDALSAFGTPTIVHFCVALLISCTLSAPWMTLASPAIALGAIGALGLVYAAIVIRRARTQSDYHPVFEDWLWHAALPVVGYGALLGAALALRSHAHEALFFVAAVTLLLVFIGIHNAWDTVTYVAISDLQRRAEERRRDEGGVPPADRATSTTPEG
ncbi:MAG TPA: hypothetical protein VGP25_19835 [Gemmatimonadaceae bacterium]|nr:hypothetical protein [Gemmatimonadaceae bacterium]